MPETYNKEYFDNHVNKYLNRASNHHGLKISTIKDITKYMDFKTVLDLGCCIGTFAMEFASDRKKTIGLDLSLYGLQRGKELAKEKNVNFINANAAVIPLKDNSIDLILAEDIVEHLNQDLLRSMLKECNRILSPKGNIVIHTFPTKYSFILDLFEHKRALMLLYPFSFLPRIFIEVFLYIFTKLMLPLIYSLMKGKTWKTSVAQTAHCNLQTVSSLQKEMNRAKLKIMSIWCTNLYKDFFSKEYFNIFAHSKVSKRNLFALARKG